LKVKWAAKLDQVRAVTEALPVQINKELSDLRHRRDLLRTKVGTTISQELFDGVEAVISRYYKPDILPIGLEIPEQTSVLLPTQEVQLSRTEDEEAYLQAERERLANDYAQNFAVRTTEDEQGKKRQIITLPNGKIIYGKEGITTKFYAELGKTAITGVPTPKLHELAATFYQGRDATEYPVDSLRGLIIKVRKRVGELGDTVVVHGHGPDAQYLLELHSPILDQFHARLPEKSMPITEDEKPTQEFEVVKGKGGQSYYQVTLGTDELYLTKSPVQARMIEVVHSNPAINRDDWVRKTLSLDPDQKITTAHRDKFKVLLYKLKGSIQEQGWKIEEPETGKFSLEKISPEEVRERQAQDYLKTAVRKETIDGQVVYKIQMPDGKEATTKKFHASQLIKYWAAAHIRQNWASRDDLIAAIWPDEDTATKTRMLAEHTHEATALLKEQLPEWHVRKEGMGDRSKYKVVPGSELAQHKQRTFEEQAREDPSLLDLTPIEQLETFYMVDEKRKNPFQKGPLTVDLRFTEGQKTKYETEIIDEQTVAERRTINEKNNLDIGRLRKVIVGKLKIKYGIEAEDPDKMSQLMSIPEDQLSIEHYLQRKYMTLPDQLKEDFFRHVSSVWGMKASSDITGEIKSTKTTWTPVM